MAAPQTRRRVLLTGATRYIGGRLLPVLEACKDVALRCLVRRPDFLRPRVARETEVVAGDVRDAASLAAAREDVGVAYYLVHAMGEPLLRAHPRAGEQAARDDLDPLGLSGRLYWYALWPLHAYVFGGILRELARRAESDA